MGRSRHAALAALTALCVGCLPAFVSGGPHGLRSATSRSLRSGAVRRAGNEEAGRIVILGAGLQGAALAYFLTRRGVKPVVVERDKVAAAASGKGGGFLARDWGDSITRKLHTVSFKLHEELAETLGIESYRKLPVLSAAPGPRSDRTSDMCPWLDGEVADVRVMDPNGAQVAPLELCTKLMDAAVEAGAELRIGTAEGVETAEDGDIERVTGVIVDGETLPADKVCVCLGPWAALAQDWFGMPVPMTGVKSSSIVFKSDEPVEPFAIFCGEDPRFGTHLEIYPRNSGEVYICGIGGSEYGIKSSEFRSAKPTVVLTQALCDVCAPSSRQVSGARELIQEEMTVVNLEPHSLRDVADTFATVSEAVTGSTKTGDALASEFHAGLGRIASAVSQPERKRPRSPRCVLLEWADPLFDGGHWIPEMLVAAGGEKGWQSPGNKSKKIEPSVLTDYDPDCILVACCGFDLHRNLEDAQKLWSKPWWTSLRCVKEGKVFAADGNRYFARPGPSLVAGVAIMARIIHDDVPGVVSAVEATGLLPAEGVAWGRVEPPGLQASGVPGQPCDIEDFCWSLHKEACQRGERFYLDPKTGYQVMTEVAHKKRGKCCGCGCRHCPYNHANVPSTERAARIQQPAWLHKTSIEAEEVDVLFWSGGKDSYLALRTLLKEKGEGRRGVVLMTTFDARTRIIAHQEVEIKTVVRQAETLGVSLVGAPLHPGRKYEEQLEQALRVAQKGLSGIPITRVCFGDLHLEHIRSWREQQLTPVVREVCGQAAQLHYPIWHKSYEDLMADLVASGVKCRISAMPDAAPSEVQGLCVGALFDPVLAKQATSIGWDAFGENGEFHSVVEPWA